MNSRHKLQLRLLLVAGRQLLLPHALIPLLLTGSKGYSCWVNMCKKTHHQFCVDNASQHSRPQRQAPCTLMRHWAERVRTEPQLDHVRLVACPLQLYPQMGTLRTESEPSEV